MQIKTDHRSFFVFDLDDTLYPEIDFLKSAYKALSDGLAGSTGKLLYNEMLRRYRKKENVFQWLSGAYRKTYPHLTFDWLLNEYREHFPSITLPEETRRFLSIMRKRNIPAVLITDGRSRTQRNKLKALGIEDFFCEILISEEFGSAKPDARNYRYFEEKYPEKTFFFFGDNTAKDFIVPLQLGWTTICLENKGQHIHPQDFTNGSCPHFRIPDFAGVRLL